MKLFSANSSIGNRERRKPIWYWSPRQSCLC